MMNVRIADSYGGLPRIYVPYGWLKAARRHMYPGVGQSQEVKRRPRRPGAVYAGFAGRAALAPQP